jgi:hypothetical protein
MDQGEQTALIYIHIPEKLDAEEREARYGDPIDSALTIAGAGYVSGGGTLFDAPDDDGFRDIIHCGVDVDAYELETGLALLREQLVELGCPPETRLIYPDNSREDVFDGSTWQIGVASRHVQ